MGGSVLPPSPGPTSAGLWLSSSAPLLETSLTDLGTYTSPLSLSGHIYKMGHETEWGDSAPLPGGRENSGAKAWSGRGALGRHGSCPPGEPLSGQQPPFVARGSGPSGREKPQPRLHSVASPVARTAQSPTFVSPTLGQGQPCFCPLVEHLDHANDPTTPDGDTEAQKGACQKQVGVL